MTLVQISAGRGPVEVKAFVAELADELLRVVTDAGGTAEVVDQRVGSARIRCEGLDLGDWLGTHVLVDPVRGRRKRRRWFCALAVVREGAVQSFDPSDVVMAASRAGGPGGQHVNTTSSAIRACHTPTGLSVRVTGERSQHRNRAVALRLLEERVAELERSRVARREHSARVLHDRVERGSAVASWIRVRGILTRSSS